MIVTIPRSLVLIVSCAIAIHSALAAVLRIATTPSAGPSGPALALFVTAFLLLAVGTEDRRPAVWVAVCTTVIAMVLPLLGTIGLDPAHASFTSGGWYVEAIASLVILLFWRRCEPFAWIAMSALVVHTAVWGGLQALAEFAVFATVLLLALVTAGGWALRRTSAVLAAHAEAEQRTIAYQAAQDAYHAERQVRLATTARLGDTMLQRIVEQDGVLDPADRAECRVLEQTIRDEIRGRRLLNDALRDQVIAHRRAGAIVQVNDDGGLDDLDPAEIDPMLTRIAEAIAPLHSDRIIIRTAPKDSDKAITVVAMSTDPIAAALGMDDGDEQVDLWLELDRPRPAQAVAS